MTFLMSEDEHNSLSHYGIKRKSGRYPWGSGDNPNQRAKTFQDQLKDLRSKGMADKDIAAGFGMTLRELRETNTIARNQVKQDEIAFAQRLKDKGYSNIAIGQRFDPPRNESSVRSMLAAGQKEKADILTATSNMLRDQVNEKGYVDVGKGVSNTIGVSNEKLGSALALLKDEGYTVENVQVDQAGTQNKTTVRVLAKPGETYGSIKQNLDKIQQVQQFTDDGGRSFFGLLPPKVLDSSRVAIRYGDEGGAEHDGVLYIRPGKDDISLGGSHYAQVRVLVDGTHYLKGMAMYKNDLPKGVDVMFNTNKNKADIGTNKLDAMKKITDDPDNPFGAMVKQIGIHDEKGNITELTSVMNIVNKEGDWEGWRKSISSQVLSKQSPDLAKRQLDEAYQRKREDLDEIMSLTNPAIKKKLLDAYATSADSSAVHMKAAALPRQRAQVILPIDSLKDNEVYAPNFRDGERVALIRYPHGGTFEIPELTVNNRHPEARSLLGQAEDAIGINSKVASHLSGADFDGDTVLVIPNNNRQLKTSPPLDALKNFDPQRDYKLPEGQVFKGNKQQLMGDVSNLITDMTIKGASHAELAQAVKHSMVVIDSEKHNLDWQRSARDNGITALKKKYQGRGNAGAATLISRAKSRQMVDARRPRPMAKGGPIDKATGRKVYETKPDAKYVDKVTGETRYRQQRSTKLAEADNAHTLVSDHGGTKIEAVYADHSNRMKSLANEARKASLSVPNLKMSPSAKEVYKNEVESLNAKLNIALKNSPKERQAQLFAHATLASKRAANPNMDSAQIKKVNAQALAEARVRFGARKKSVEVTDSEWDAIQAGAISNHKLKQILDNTDIDRIRELATPRPRSNLFSGAAASRAKAMIAAGRTQAEVADALGMSLTTLKEGLKNG